MFKNTKRVLSMFYDYAIFDFFYERLSNKN